MSGESTQESELESGTQVGDYVVEALLGLGAFGAVYQAVQPVIGKHVAIKVLRRRFSDDPEVISRFVAEARAVNQIGHKNIIDIFSFGRLPDGRHYHIMELLVGVPLDVYVRRSGGRLPLSIVVPLMRNLGRALDAAHAAGIAHRDLKPANIFLLEDEDKHLTPKLLDFGVAKLLSLDLPKDHQTQSGAAIGTPDYMSPEQCRGPNVDHRTDIYAFGCVMFRLLTGRHVFVGQSVMDVLLQQLSKPAPQLTDVAADLPENLNEPVACMLAKDPAARPPNLKEAMAKFEAALTRAGLEIPINAQDPKFAEMVAPKPVAASGPLLRTPWPAQATQTSIAQPTKILPKQPHRKRWVILGSGVMSVVAVLILSWYLVETDDLYPLQSAQSPTSASATLPTTSTKTHPQEVLIWFANLPKDTTILGPNDAVLAVTPQPVRFQYGVSPIALRFKKEGYEEAELMVWPSRSATLSLSLREQPKIQRRRPKRTKRDEIEEAFQ